MQHGQQEDAEEFLSCILNRLHDEMVALIKLPDKGISRVNFVLGTCSLPYIQQHQTIRWRSGGLEGMFYIAKCATSSYAPLTVLSQHILLYSITLFGRVRTLLCQLL